MSAIQAKGIAKSYGHIKALAGVSFEVGKGEVIGLLGPNGAGKSTLMKILTGFIEPDEGHAAIHGIDVVAEPLAAQRRIGYLPESAPLYGEMLVQEYLEMMASLRGVEAGDRRARLGEAIRATGLTDRMVQPISTLSKGYRQRVGIAQAIIHRPDVLILDEPTSGLDPTQIAEIRDLIKRLAVDTTVLLSTHILSEVEMTCERVLVIMRGTLRADAPSSPICAPPTPRSSASAPTPRTPPAPCTKLDVVDGVRAAGRRRDGWHRFRVTARTSAELTGAVRRHPRARLAPRRAAARSQDPRDRVPRPGGQAEQGGAAVSEPDDPTTADGDAAAKAGATDGAKAEAKAEASKPEAKPTPAKAADALPRAEALPPPTRGRSHVGTIAKKELRSFFGSPVALIFLATFLGVVLFSFFWSGSFFSRGVADVRPLFDKLPLLMILLVAALSMRMWSEEQRGRTIEILMTLPVPRVQLVLGKFVAGLLLVGLALVLTFGIPATVSTMGDLDWGPVVGGYLAAMLLAAAYLAIGMCVSAATDSQIVSLIGTIVVCGLLYLPGTPQIADQAGMATGDLLRRHRQRQLRCESIARGVLDLRPRLLHLGIVAAFLAVSVLLLAPGAGAPGRTHPGASGWRR
ncbi:MAG: ATP-binding cassette domain-containing protein [Kofleriaceae bacterium]